MENLLSRLRIGDQAFCLIQPQDSDELLVLTGNSFKCRSLAEIPRRQGATEGGRIYDTISIVPFCQIREKGYAAWDEGEQILGIDITAQQEIAKDALLAGITARPLVMEAGIHY
ncbi:MAG: hypothetical protein Q8R88_06280, partial [Desulfoprunum sp.]|nr:hypothetical protein [Desulfoprunum sp.]